MDTLPLIWWSKYSSVPANREKMKQKQNKKTPTVKHFTVYIRRCFMPLCEHNLVDVKAIPHCVYFMSKGIPMMY